MPAQCPACSSFVAADDVECPKCGQDLGEPPCPECSGEMRESGHTGVEYECDDCGHFVRDDAHIAEVL